MQIIKSEAEVCSHSCAQNTKSSNLKYLFRVTTQNPVTQLNCLTFFKSFFSQLCDTDQKMCLLFFSFSVCVVMVNCCLRRGTACCSSCYRLLNLSSGHLFDRRGPQMYWRRSRQRQRGFHLSTFQYSIFIFHSNLLYFLRLCFSSLRASWSVGRLLLCSVFELSGDLDTAVELWNGSEDCENCCIKWLQQLHKVLINSQ